MGRRIITLYFDVDRGILVSSDGEPLAQSEWPRIAYEEYPLVRLQLVDSDNVDYAGLASDDEFVAVVADDFLESTNAMAKTLASGINVAGDWLEGGNADPTSGEITIRIAADTARWSDVLSTSVEELVTLELSARPSGENYRSSIFRIPIYAVNLYDRIVWTALTADTDYTDTAASSSTITMLTDQSDNIAVGARLKLKVSGSYVYAKAVSCTSGLLTLSGTTLPLDADAIQELHYETLPS